jgi:hypothetical protein
MEESPYYSVYAEKMAVSSSLHGAPKNYNRWPVSSSPTSLSDSLRREISPTFGGSGNLQTSSNTRIRPEHAPRFDAGDAEAKARYSEGFQHRPAQNWQTENRKAFDGWTKAAESKRIANKRAELNGGIATNLPSFMRASIVDQTSTLRRHVGVQSTNQKDFSQRSITAPSVYCRETSNGSTSDLISGTAKDSPYFPPGYGGYVPSGDDVKRNRMYTNFVSHRKDNLVET